VCCVRISAANKALFVFHPVFTWVVFRSVSIAVRQKAKDLVEFVQDDDRVRDERRKAKRTKDKYIGMAAESVPRQSSM